MFQGKKYQLTDDELKGIANLCYQEQGSVLGAKAEASLMANRYEMLIDKSKYSGLYDYIRTCGWWAYAPKHMDNGSSPNSVVEGVKDVLCNGNRTLPSHVDEHDCLSDLKSISTGNLWEKDNYIKDVTIIKNVYGSTYTFYCFPDSNSDPFGYIKKPKAESTTKTVNPIDSIISKAEEEIGYLEKESNSNLSSKTENAGYSNYTKYWYDVYPEFQGEPWCACFVSWVFMKVFGLDIAKKMFKHWPFVYCPTLASMTDNKQPKVGSVILFYRNGEYVHTGIVVEVGNEYIKTIEGNTSGGSTIIDNGGGVCKKVYDRFSLSSNTKYFYPDYSLVDEDFKEVSFFDSTTIIRFGDESNFVKELQINLNKLGYDLDTDGEFGKLTLKAVKDFQEVSGLEVDGEVGSMTKQAIKTAIESGLPKPDSNTKKVRIYTFRNNAPIRENHFGSSPLIGRIKGKVELTQTGKTYANKKGKMWYEVNYEGIVGWIYETNLKVVRE